MQLDDVLGRSVERVTRATGSTATAAADLVAESAVTATGRTPDRQTVGRTPALAAALLALAALGAIVLMRRVFSGAIS